MANPTVNPITENANTQITEANNLINSINGLDARINGVADKALNALVSKETKESLFVAADNSEILGTIDSLSYDDFRATMGPKITDTVLMTNMNKNAYKDARVKAGHDPITDVAQLKEVFENLTNDNKEQLFLTNENGRKISVFSYPRDGSPRKINKNRPLLLDAYFKNLPIEKKVDLIVLYFDEAKKEEPDVKALLDFDVRDEYKKIVQETNNCIKDLRKVIQENEELLNKADEKRNEKEIEIQETEQELAAEKEAIKKANKELRKLNEEKRVLNSEKTSLESQLADPDIFVGLSTDETNKKKIELKEKINEKDSQINALTNGKMKTKEDKVARHTAKEATLTKTIATGKRNLKKLDKQYTEYKAAHEKAKEDIKKKIEELQSTLNKNNIEYTIPEEEQPQPQVQAQQQPQQQGQGQPQQPGQQPQQQGQGQPQQGQQPQQQAQGQPQQGQAQPQQQGQGQPQQGQAQPQQQAQGQPQQGQAQPQQPVQGQPQQAQAQQQGQLVPTNRTNNDMAEENLEAFLNKLNSTNGFNEKYQIALLGKKKTKDALRTYINELNAKYTPDQINQMISSLSTNFQQLGESPLTWNNTFINTSTFKDAAGNSNIEDVKNFVTTLTNRYTTLDPTVQQNADVLMDYLKVSVLNYTSNNRGILKRLRHPIQYGKDVRLVSELQESINGFTEKSVQIRGERDTLRDRFLRSLGRAPSLEEQQQLAADRAAREARQGRDTQAQDEQQR